jgi:hypothetical protein
MAAKPNATALAVLQAAHQAGDWVTGAELAELTGLAKSKVFSAINRLIDKADDWCGPGGWDWRVITYPGSVGGATRQIRVDTIVNIPETSTASDRVRSLLATNPELGPRELARLAGCSEPTASLVRKEWRLFGPAGRPPATRGCKASGGEESSTRGVLMEDEQVGGRMNRTFRQLWPLPGRVSA